MATSPQEKRAETALRNRLLRLGWTLRPEVRPALTIYDWHNPTAPASLVRILKGGIWRHEGGMWQPEWELRLWAGTSDTRELDLVTLRVGRNPLALAREAMRESALLDSRLRLGWQPRLATDTGEVTPPGPRRGSSEVDVLGYGANIYGCQPCPRCLSNHRYVAAGAPGIIKCCCEYREPVTRDFDTERGIE